MLSIITLIAAVIPTTPATHASAVDFTWLFLKMLLILGIVCIFAILLLKYAVPRTGLFQKFSQGRFFRVHARQSIEPRKTLYVVELGTRYLVLGVSDHAINFITELTEAEFEEMQKPVTGDS